MLDERTGCALQTRDERMTLGRTKNGVILSEVEGSRHALSLRWCVTTAAIACLLSLICLSACTDYVEQMKDDFDDWEAERALESSAALVAASASSDSALVAASASSDSALASSRGIKESFSSLDELDVRVYAYQYDLYGLDFLHLHVENNEEDNLDSLTLRLYLEALPEEIEKCATLVDVDFCQKIDSTGFSKPCERVDDLRVLMRYSLPMRLDNLKKSGESRYTYYIPVPLGILESHTRIRLDIGFSSGISNDGYTTCETLRTTAKKRMSATSGDWSWSPHVAAEDGADYAGMPLEDKDYGDFVDNVIPVNPYVVVTRNEQYISGISPSFADKKIVSSSSSSAKSSSSEKLSSSSVTPKSSSSSKVTELVEVTVGSMTDSRDGLTYKTVTIGSQTWMAENLNYETAASYCYNDDATNCTKYGRLYTWTAATMACPSGWHLPSKAEWETLFNAVGSQSTAGKELKSTSGWTSSGNGTDAFGFSALPAGFRPDDGYYDGEGGFTDLWSSTEYGSDRAFSMSLGYDGDGALLSDCSKTYYGFSVRCLKDNP